MTFGWSPDLALPWVIPWQACCQVHAIRQLDGCVLQGVHTNVNAALSNSTVNYLCKHHNQQQGTATDWQHTLAQLVPAGYTAAVWCHLSNDGDATDACQLCCCYCCCQAMAQREPCERTDCPPVKAPWPSSLSCPSVCLSPCVVKETVLKFSAVHSGRTFLSSSCTCTVHAM